MKYKYLAINFRSGYSEEKQVIATVTDSTDVAPDNAANSLQM